MPIERLLYIVRMRLRSLFGGRSLDRELDEELRYHLDRSVEANVARGRTPTEARRAALAAIGGVESRKEECRDARRVRPLDDLGRDLQYGVRTLRRNPTFTIVAVLSLALGLGANTAIFQLIDAVRLRPLPVAKPRELAAIQILNREWPPGDYSGRYADVTYPQWERIRDRQQAFSGVFAWGHASFDLASRGASRFVENGLWVSGDFFRVLGVQPAIGRLFMPADDVVGCDAPGVVISHAFWRRWLGGAPSAIGTTLTIQGHALEVIGVTPAGFFGVEVGRSFDLALPLCADRLMSGEDNRLGPRATWWLAVMGRLKPGWSIAQADAHLASISSALFQETVPPRYGVEDAARYLGFKLGAQPAPSGFSQLRLQYDRPLWMLLAIAGVVLLIACANVANLMLARMSNRAREMSVRLALGASRWRLVRQLLVESLVIAAAGAVMGLWLAPVLGRSVVGLISSEVSPMFVDLSTDWRVVAFASALAVSTCILFGLAPALRASKTPPGDAMKVAGRSATAGRAHAVLRRALVTTQVALSMALLVMALLFARSLFNLLTLDAGFQQTGILEADIDIGRLTLSPESQRAFRKDMLERIRSIPGVESAASASIIPMAGRSYTNVFFEGWPGRQKEQAYTTRVSGGYFRTLNTAVIAGRDFDERDTPTSPTVVIVNAVFASRFLNGTNPVGTTVRLEGVSGEPGPVVQIVGLVDNTKYGDLREDFKPIVYRAQSQRDRVSSFESVLIRSTGAAATLIPAVTRAIEGANGDVSFHFHDFQEQIRYSLLQDRLMATLCGFFAALAAVLATIGVYGVTAYSAARRTAEIGIRLALGAARHSILALLLREAVIVVSAGMVIGVALTIVAGKAAGAMLFGLQPQDPATLGAAAAILAAAAGAASYGPARRASRTDPANTLRDE